MNLIVGIVNHYLAEHLEGCTEGTGVPLDSNVIREVVLHYRPELEDMTILRTVLTLKADHEHWYSVVLIATYFDDVKKLPPELYREILTQYLEVGDEERVSRLAQQVREAVDKVLESAKKEMEIQLREKVRKKQEQEPQKSSEEVEGK